MAVTDFKSTFVAVLIGGNEFRYYHIHRDEELIKMLISLETSFWEKVINKVMPDVDGSDACSQLLLKMFPNSMSAKITLPEEALGLITQYYAFKDDEMNASESKDEASNKLKLLLGENETGVIGNRLVSWKSLSTDRFDSKRFKIDMPETYPQYINTTISRRFTIK